MALIVDAGPLVVLADRGDERHRQVRALVEDAAEALYLSPFVLAEADYLVFRQHGLAAEMAMLRDVSGGRFLLEPFGPDDIRACSVTVERYRDLGIGLADASVAFLAERHGTRRILTFDERLFRTIQTSAGEPFTILPGDEPPRRRRR